MSQERTVARSGLTARQIGLVEVSTHVVHAAEEVNLTRQIYDEYSCQCIDRSCIPGRRRPAIPRGKRTPQNCMISHAKYRRFAPLSDATRLKLAVMPRSRGDSIPRHSRGQRRLPGLDILGNLCVRQNPYAMNRVSPGLRRKKKQDRRDHGERTVPHGSPL